MNRVHSLLAATGATRTSPEVSWGRLAKEAIRCNIAGLHPDSLDHVGIGPLCANLWLTSRCSGRCQTCTEWRGPVPGEMTTDELREALASLRSAGVRIVYLCGGDVFLRSDVFEVIRCASAMGLWVHLTLNAFTIDEKIAQALMASRAASVHLSLDTLGADFDRVRGVRDSAAKVLGALESLRRHSSSVKLGITTTIMKSTLPAIREIVEFTIANDLTIFFNLMNFTHHFFATEFSKEQYELDGHEKQQLRELVQWLKRQHLVHPRLIPAIRHLDWIVQYFDDHHVRRPPCYQTMLKVCVRSNGDVRPCCSMDTVGNLRRNGLKEILASKEYMAVLKRALRKECPGCSCRYTLNLDVSIRARMAELWRRCAPGGAQ